MDLFYLGGEPDPIKLSSLLEHPVGMQEVLACFTLGSRYAVIDRRRRVARLDFCWQLRPVAQKRSNERPAKTASPSSTLTDGT
jgi:hypothetical protein